MSSKTKEGKDGTCASFSITSESSSFSNRSNDIFGGLEALEKKHAAHQKTLGSSQDLEKTGVIKLDPVIDDRDNLETQRINQSRSSTSTDGASLPSHQRRNRYRPPRSCNNDRRDRNFPRDNFRRPGRLPLRTKRIPDFKKHPEKWTSYSLEDVSEKDLSEKSNTRAALDFLWERKNERERQERLDAGLPAEEVKFESETAACSKGMISFSKKSKEKKADSCDKSGSNPISLDAITMGETFSEQDNEVLSSSTDAELKNIRSDSGKHKSGFSSSYSNQDDCNDDVQGKDDSVPTFKSRKNVRKQFRRKNHDDETGDNDG